MEPPLAAPPPSNAIAGGGAVSAAQQTPVADRPAASPAPAAGGAAVAAAQQPSDAAARRTAIRQALMGPSLPVATFRATKATASVDPSLALFHISRGGFGSVSNDYIRLERTNINGVDGHVLVFDPADARWMTDEDLQEIMPDVIKKLEGFPDLTLHGWAYVQDQGQMKAEVSRWQRTWQRTNPF